MKDKKELREKFYACTSDNAYMSIIIGDMEGFRDIMGVFWEYPDIAEKYIGVAIRESRYDFLKYITDRIVQEGKIPHEKIIKILTVGMEKASGKQNTQSVNILLNAFGGYPNSTEMQEIMRKSLMSSCSMYSRDVSDISFIDFLVNKGADLNYTTDRPPYSFIENVMLCNRPVLAEMLILREDFDISCHQPPKAKYSILNSAISSVSEYESKKLVRAILEKGGDINYIGGGEDYQMPSPAGLAAAKNDLVMLHILAEAGADMSKKDMSGHSPVDYVRRISVAKGRESTLIGYLNMITDDSVMITVTKEDKNLISAIKKNNLSLVRRALKKGADPNTYFKPQKYLIPALGYAILLGCDPDITKELLNAGADPNAVDLNGIPPQNMLSMELECMSAGDSNNEITYNGVKLVGGNTEWEFRKYGQIKSYEMFEEKLLKIRNVLEALLSAGAKPGIFVNMLDYNGILLKDNNNTVKQNLSFGLLLNIFRYYRDIYWRESADEQRILNYSEAEAKCNECRKIIEDICRMMLNNGLDPNRIDQNEITALELAAQCNLNNILRMLFEAGAKGAKRSRNDLSPFFAAIPCEVQNFWSYSFRDVPRKFHFIDPNDPPGINGGDRRMSDMELAEKINSIKTSVDIFAEYGFAPEKAEINNNIKHVKTYEKFPELHSYILSCAERERRKNILTKEDSEVMKDVLPDWNI